MPSTFTPIATTTIGSATNSITFSSLGSYTDIYLVAMQKENGGGGYELQVRFNGDTGANYIWGRMLAAAGSTIEGSGTTVTTSARFGDVDGGWQTSTLNIMSYAGSRIKTAIGRTMSVNSSTQVTRTGGYVTSWLSTSAITSITIKVESTGQFAAGSIFSIYGIQAAA
jgi:hypothetical protein